MEATLNGPSGQVNLGTSVLTLGRVPDNAIVVNDVKASGHHAEVRPIDQGYIVIDLGSTNGTFVNGMQLTPQVPQVLKTFDVIRIGDSSYTYQVTGSSSVAQTVYASPAPSSSPGYQPTVAAAPPTAYGGYAPQLEYLPLPAQPAYSPPPPPYNQPQVGAAPYPGFMPSPPDGQVYPGMPAAATKVGGSDRKRLYLIGGAVAVAVLVGIILMTALNASTPSKTLGAFCDGIMKPDYHAAFETLSTSQQSKGSEAGLAKNFAGVTSCTYSNVQQSGSTATADMVLGNNQGITVPGKAKLINEGGTWKLDDLNVG